ncbi:MAG: hypothetical protein PHR35_06595 [Kiritimatiellae bacterium]|nr:hypothetical protein [Kiritimatiellia bacterium]
MSILPLERNHQFRERLEQVHLPDRRIPGRRRMASEMEIGEGWTVAIPRRASSHLFRAAQDLQDYLAVSMRVPVIVLRTDVRRLARTRRPRAIVLGTRRDLPAYGAGLRAARGYRLAVQADGIVVCGYDERGVAQGCYQLEDRMNLRQAPLLPTGTLTREPLFAPRMVHSGWGLDRYTDAHLNAMAHAGLDTILVFAKDVDTTTSGYLDFNDVVRRAANFGLDVYLYSYIKSRKHPDEPDATAYYENSYGRLIASCPGVKGIVFVGESCEFPSKDPRANGRLNGDPVPPGQEHDKRPLPGWWPCRDYPQWLNMVKAAMRKHNPALDVVFWTYNWGWAPAADRLALIESLPGDISLQVTFEMFENVVKGGIVTRCVDYTASFEGPGEYFRSEAAAAHARRLPLYAMANTGGLTWDIGVIPYEPIPYQWKRRWDALLRARRDWGLSGLMESHHFGWWPSFVSELCKEQYWSGGMDFERHIRLIAERDFGAAGAADALAAWALWSDAFRDYVPTNEDQYGPFRIGPAYPLVFLDEDVRIPSAPYAHFGAAIVITRYGRERVPNVDSTHAEGNWQGEMRLLRGMARKLRVGVKLLDQARRHAPAARADEAARMVLLGRFIECCVQTTFDVKQWFLCGEVLRRADASAAAKRFALDEMVAIARREAGNVRRALPLVRQDSRLGWEPSMEYLCDAAHLEWKLAQLRQVVDEAIPAFRRGLAGKGSGRKRSG